MLWNVGLCHWFYTILLLCLCVVLFKFLLIGICWNSCINGFIGFIKFENILAIGSSNSFVLFSSQFTPLNWYFQLHICYGVLGCITELTESLFVFSFFLPYFILDSFYYYILKATVFLSWSDSSDLNVVPSSVFFILHLAALLHRMVWVFFIYLFHSSVNMLSFLYPLKHVEYSYSNSLLIISSISLVCLYFLIFLIMECIFLLFFMFGSFCVLFT